MRLLRELQDEGRLFRVVVRTADRKQREMFATTPTARKRANARTDPAADDPATIAEAA